MDFEERGGDAQVWRNNAAACGLAIAAGLGYSHFDLLDPSFFLPYRRPMQFLLLLL